MSAAAVLTLAFVAFIVRAPAAEAPWVFCGALLLALLVYPGSLTHYSVLHAIPILAVWARFGSAKGTALAAGMFVCIDYALVNAPGGQLILAANLFALCALAWLIARRVESRAPRAA
jgi:hypothetical protein